MKLANSKWWLVILGWAVLLGGAPASFAQEEPHRGELVLGVRYIVNEPGSSKFTEYRHVPQGLYIQRFWMELEDPWKKNTFLNFQTRETLEKDQAYLLSLGQLGKYRFEFRWDQTPHDFTNTARGFFLSANPGVYTAPSSVVSSLQTSTGNLSTLLGEAPSLGVALRRDMGAGRFFFTPRDHWRFELTYGREKQTGVRPFGTTTNSFTNVIELPEPIDYRTHRLGFLTEFANKRGGIQIGYNHSFFVNNITELRWDNPFRIADAVNGSMRGRLDLYPDNSANSFTIAGAFNLGEDTRYMGSVVPGWMRQNDPFLPFTVNTALTPPSLPAQSLNGKKQTLAMNHTLASNIIPHFQIGVRYRSYDYNNETPSLPFMAGYVRTDGSVSTTARQSLPYSYDKKSLGWDGSWEFFKGQFWKVGYEWERMDREHRDVEQSTEHSVGTSLDLNPYKWMVFRLAYRHSSRAPSHYEPNEESFPLGEGAFALGQLHELRKFDQAERVRDRADALLQLDLTNRLVFSAVFGTTQDDYRRSLYGMYSDINLNYGVDLTYSPRSEVSFFAEYGREKYRSAQRSRQRTPPSATLPANDSTNNDWESRARDLVDTWSVGVNLSLFNNRFTADNYYSLSSAHGLINTRALGSALIPGFLVTSAVNYPDTNNRYHLINTTLRCHLSDRFIPRLDYRYERYDRVDFQVAPMQPYMVPLDPSTSTSIFLGANVPRYKVHILGFGLEYRF